MSSPHSMRWDQDDDGLVLRLGPQVSAHTQITGDVEVDVLRLDADLALIAAAQRTKVTEQDQRVRIARDRLGQLKGGWLHPGHAAAAAELRRAIDDHATASARLADLGRWTRYLRSFVITMREPPGLLAEAAAGWRRSPHVPAGVLVFSSENDFLAADTRRAIPDWRPAVLRSDVVGELWRRDGDDPPGDVLHREGSWQVGHLPRTGEIYAAYRGASPHRGTIWLLGKGFSSSTAHEMLTSLLPRMPEPNSLILVADTVRAASQVHPRASASADAELQV